MLKNTNAKKYWENCNKHSEFLSYNPQVQILIQLDTYCPKIIIQLRIIIKISIYKTTCTFVPQSGSEIFWPVKKNIENILKYKLGLSNITMNTVSETPIPHYQQSFTSFHMYTKKRALLSFNEYVCNGEKFFILISQ